MPESKSKYVQQDLLVTTGSSDAEDLLNPAELKTVLDMLAVIETVEELSMLECLTELQKRQVWAVTPESVKQQLWQIRTTGSKPPPIERSSQTLSDSPHCTGVVLEDETLDTADLDEDIDNLDELDEPLQSSSVSLTASSSALSSVASSTQPVLQVNDWIILKAHPQLNAAELKAIWQIVEIQGEFGKVTTDRLGSRIYPTNWMVLYPQPQNEPEYQEDEEDELEF